MMSILAEGTATSISDALTNVSTMVSTVVTTITNNEVLMTLFCSSLLITGVKVFKKIKKAARA